MSCVVIVDEEIKMPIGTKPCPVFLLECTKGHLRRKLKNKPEQQRFYFSRAQTEAILKSINYLEELLEEKNK